MIVPGEVARFSPHTSSQMRLGHPQHEGMTFLARQQAPGVPAAAQPSAVVLLAARTQPLNSVNRLPWKAYCYGHLCGGSGYTPKVRFGDSTTHFALIPPRFCCGLRVQYAQNFAACALCELSSRLLDRWGREQA